MLANIRLSKEVDQKFSKWIAAPVKIAKKQPNIAVSVPRQIPSWNFRIRPRRKTMELTTQTEASVLIFVGLFLLVGFSAHILGRRTHVPRVTLLLLLGFVAGPYALGLVPQDATSWFPLAA